MPTELEPVIPFLTPEQEAELPAFRERWRAVGLATDPIDPDRAARAVRALYRTGQVGEPSAVIVLASPMACRLALAIIQRLPDGCLDSAKPEVWDRFGRGLWPQIVPQLKAQLGTRIGALLRSNLGAPFWPQLAAPMGDRLWDRIGHQLRERLGERLWARLREELREELWGQLRHQLSAMITSQVALDLGAYLFQPTDFIGGMDATWLSYYDFAAHIGVALEPAMKARYEAFKDYALSAGWMYAYQPIAFVSDRPAEIHFDAQRRLHRATGMAVRFRDGWGIHAWHGRLIPARLIEERHAISPDTIEAEANVELRRVALEIFGFDRYLATRGAEVIATDELHGQTRRLLEVKVAGAPVRIVEVMNGSREADGSRRRFHLGALRGETPHAVIAASYGIAPRVYSEAVRT